MIILSHRGYWKDSVEKNSIVALERSLDEDFGLETDIRDYGHELVISHDMPDSSSLRFSTFLEMYKSKGSSVFLALNVKSDGLQVPLKRALDEYNISNYFIFDMSVPDHFTSLKSGFKTFTRVSEIEPSPTLLEESEGLWLDQFLGDWIDSKTIIKYMDIGKKVCIVSPELHNRDKGFSWSEYKKLPSKYLDKVMLCTDYPEEARAFFND